MPMKMGWRWYGEGNDPITLNDIKQIPGVTSIVWALHDKMPGEIWEVDEIQKVADRSTPMASIWTLWNRSTFMMTSRSACDARPVYREL